MNDLETGINWALFEKSPVPICETDLNGNFLKVNQKWCELTGYSASELKTMDFQQITVAEDLITDLSMMKKAIEDNERGSYPFTKSYVKKDGSIVTFKLTANTIIENGNIVGFIGWAMPINYRCYQSYFYWGLFALNLFSLFLFYLLK